MKKTLLFITIAFVTFPIAFYGQEEKAADKYANYAFVDAIESYEDLVQKGYTSQEIYKNLGNANYYNANYPTAAEWYSKLMELEDAEIEAEYLYRYAQSLKSLKKYDESDKLMQKFESKKAKDYRVEKFNKNTDYLEKIEEMSGRYEIENLPINSESSDFAPSFNRSMLIFSTARDTGITSRNIHKWNDKSFLNLYSSDLSENGELVNLKKFSKKLNTKTHESSTAFTKDGNTVYFTRNNSENGSFARDEEGISRLKIYKATLENEEWENVTELPFNSDDYSVAHPTLNHDETILYFASDMPGTLGASDIFMVNINADGTFGKPKNLGKEINTEARETFPFITESNVLYFASDGHPGLGGLDVFATKIEDLENIFIVNVGKPVNSQSDDFSFIINEKTGKGYFASNRSGGIGSDDIYSFTETSSIKLSCNSAISGTVKDEKTEGVIANAELSVLDENGAIIAKTFSEENGSFSMDGNCSKGSFKILASRENYEDGMHFFETTTADAYDLTVLLTPIRKAAAVGTDLAKVLDLKPIYFDLNKSKIRPDAMIELNKILEYMKIYPNVKIAIGSHTDSRGRDGYNLSLSERRAKSTVDYLVSNGIDASRITGQGYGESKLVNRCSNGVKCSNAEHELNRRSEFIVVE